MSELLPDEIRLFHIYLIDVNFGDYKHQGNYSATSKEHAVKQWCVEKGYVYRGPINRKRTRFYIDTREGGKTKLIQVMVI